MFSSQHLVRARVARDLDGVLDVVEAAALDSDADGMLELARLEAELEDSFHDLHFARVRELREFGIAGRSSSHVTVGVAVLVRVVRVGVRVYGSLQRFRGALVLALLVAANHELPAARERAQWSAIISNTH